MSQEAKTPVQNQSVDAGFDLFSVESDWLRPHERKLFKTDIVLEIPEGYYGRIAPRSGLALKQGLDVLAGVIDASYRGNIGVILYNTSSGDESNSVKIEKGQKIAQIIFEKCFYPEFEEGDLSETERGENGYGSSDVRPLVKGYNSVLDSQ